MKQLIPSLLPLVAVFALFGSVTSSVEAGGMPKVLFQTSMGDFTVELEPELAPQTVENFLNYVRKGHYDGTIFHRVIKGFMIQGGGFDKNFLRQDTGAPVPNEADKGLPNERGTIAMARTSDPHSATDQFFVNSILNRFLNHRSKTQQGWGYTAFGRVIDGMNIVGRISRVATGAIGPFPSDVPLEPVIIIKAKITSE
ncbi:MAG: peptidylprolyl isomerase [Rhodospirillales bacterium]|jgi:cyclophilin family peptidyl-prolyl cis-trans isomerase|nr:peptidylprolyl isomerase [Rhodospirillales bacterium]